MLTENPIIITGMPKSGTSLTVQILNNHEDCLLDFEIPATLAVMRGYKMTIDPSSNIYEFIKNMGLDPLCKKHHDELITSGAFRNMIRTLFGQMHSGWNTGKRWGSTTKPLLNHHTIITDLYPDAEFLFVLRDPRDIWASMKSWKPGPHWLNAIKPSDAGPDMIIKRYNRFLDLFMQIDEQHRYFIKYEDIVADPTIVYRTLKLPPSSGDILDGIGDIYQARHLPFSSDQAPDEIMNSVGRWKHDLIEEEAVQVVEGCRRLYDMGFY